MNFAEKRFKVLIIFLSLCVSILASQSTLVIGCRPWDDNICSFSERNSAYFIDSWLGIPDKIPSELPQTFHRVDLNDEDEIDPTQTNTIELQKFSDFSEKYMSHFDNIVVHWLTEYMIKRRGPAWGNCFKILKDYGTLIVPVMTKIEHSNVEEFTNILRDLGFAIEEKQFDENEFLERRFELLEQIPKICLVIAGDDKNQHINWKKILIESFQPLIIVATKIP
jgi:hypothetical protein